MQVLIYIDNTTQKATPFHIVTEADLDEFDELDIIELYEDRLPPEMNGNIAIIEMANPNPAIIEDNELEIFGEIL